MQIEIVEFYPHKKYDEQQLLTGTLHVYVIDLGLDIRGIYVCRKKNKWLFTLPHFSAIDEETQLRVRYPIIMFTDQEKNKLFKKEVISKGKAYISENFPFSVTVPEPAI